MISFKDFDTDGKVDWEALRLARISAGEICSRCNTMNVAYCRAPQDPANGHCSTAGCGNAAPPQASDDPFDEPGYQRFLTETAKTCRARHTPCPGCVAGGMCDGDLGGVFSRDADSEIGDGECDYDEDSP